MLPSIDPSMWSHAWSISPDPTRVRNQRCAAIQCRKADLLSEISLLRATPASPRLKAMQRELAALMMQETSTTTTTTNLDVVWCAVRDKTVTREVLRDVTPEQMNRRDMDGRTALVRAVLTRDLVTIELLLAAQVKPDVNKTDSKSNKTPLMFASAVNDLDIVQALLQAGASASLTDVDGCTALHHCAAGGANKSIIDLLLAAGGNNLLRITNNNGETALQTAIAHGYEEVSHLVDVDVVAYTKSARFLA